MFEVRSRLFKIRDDYSAGFPIPIEYTQQCPLGETLFRLTAERDLTRQLVNQVVEVAKLRTRQTVTWWDEQEDNLGSKYLVVDLAHCIEHLAVIELLGILGQSPELYKGTGSMGKTVASDSDNGSNPIFWLRDGLGKPHQVEESVRRAAKLALRSMTT